MNGFLFFLADMNQPVKAAATDLFLFLYQSSVLIVAAWGIAGIFRKSPSVRSAVWTTVLLLLPVLPLIGPRLTELPKPYSLTIHIDTPGATKKPAMLTTAPEAHIMTDGVTSRVRSNENRAVHPATVLFRSPWAAAFILYCLIVVALLIRLIVQAARVQAWKTGGQTIKSGRIPVMLDACKRRLGITGTVQVVHSLKIPVPMVYGVFSPTILLPTRVISSGDTATLDMILAHECIHISRRDNLLLVYTSVVNALLFFHPLVQGAVRYAVAAVEDAVDFRLVTSTSSNPADYASALYTIAVSLRTPAMIPVFARNNRLHRRVAAILTITTARKEEPVMKKIGKYFALSAIGLASLISFIAISQSSGKQPETYMTVYGTVLDPDGNPIAGVAVDAVRETAAPVNFGNSLTGDCRFMVVTGSNGSFRISFPDKITEGQNTTFEKLVKSSNKRNKGIVLIAHAGNKWMHASDHQWRDGFANGLSTPIKLSRGEHGPVTIRLTRGATIDGRVFDVSNRPMKQRLVRVAYMDSPYNRYYRPFAITDDEGNFTITNVRPGKVALIASEPFIYISKSSPYPDKAMVTLDISGGDHVENVELYGMESEELSRYNSKLMDKKFTSRRHIW